MTELVVVGGGITGLAAAYEATRGDAGDDVRVLVVEAAERLGGKIHTSTLRLPGAELAVDEGADNFLARVPDAVELCRELGLTEELTQPAIGRAKVLIDGELRFFPAESVLGVPLDFDDLAATGILSGDGLARARAEVGSTAAAPDGDVPIGAFLADHYGRELVDHVVGPLVGGINAGDVDELSLTAVTPQLAEAAADGGSLTEALRRRRAAAPPSGPVFHALRGGSGRLVEAVAAACVDAGAELRTGTRVTGLDRPTADGPVRLTLEGGTGATTVEADAVVLTTPAPAAADLLRGLSPAAATELAAIPHTSCTLVTLAYERGAIGVPLDASGFLVPRDAGLLLTAASWGSRKWPQWDDGRHVILRVSAGHTGDDRGITLGDDDLVAGLRSDLAATMGIEAEPVAVRITRYPNGFAQYTVGHLERADRIDAALAADVPGLRYTGAAMRGVGIPACIRQGRQAARAVLSRSPDR